MAYRLLCNDVLLEVRLILSLGVPRCMMLDLKEESSWRKTGARALGSVWEGWITVPRLHRIGSCNSLPFPWHWWRTRKRGWCI